MAITLPQGVAVYIQCQKENSLDIKGHHTFLILAEVSIIPIKNSGKRIFLQIMLAVVLMLDHLSISHRRTLARTSCNKSKRTSKQSLPKLTSTKRKPLLNYKNLKTPLFL